MYLDILDILANFHLRGGEEKEEKEKEKKERKKKEKKEKRRFSQCNCILKLVVLIMSF